MDGYRISRLVLVGLLSLGGSGCAWLASPTPMPTLPAALPPSPTLEQVISAVNNNSSQIHHFSSDAARLSAPGVPTLRANVAFERPQRLRLRASTGVTGPELDVGSNDELFWVWVKRQPPLYFARHDQFAASPARRTFPIEPQWLIEAMGIVEFDPTLPHEGPIRLPDGRLEIRTVRNTIDGPTTKSTIVDPATAAVLEQHVYDCRGQLVASTRTSQHRRDPLSALVMPKIVEIACPRAEFSMRIDLGNVQINRFAGSPAELWTMPVFEGWPVVDLGDPNLQFAPTASSHAVSTRICPPYGSQSAAWY